MASTGLNFANLTPDDGAVKDLKRLIFLAVTDPESLGKIFNFLPKQKHGEKVGFIGEFGMVGKASQGCNPTFGTSVIATSEKEWDIHEWEVAEKICYKDLEGTVAQVAMRTKTNIADLTGTEYTDYILAPRLELAIRKMLMRYAWFGDKAADTVTNGGNLLDSIDPAYFTLVDGFWKRLFTLAAATPDRRTTCAANAATTFAEQKAAMRQNYAAVDFLDALISDASTVLRQANGQLIYITQALKDALDADLKRNNKGSELQWTALFDGITETNYNGVQMLAIPFLDEIIKGCETVSGGKAVKVTIETIEVFPVFNPAPDVVQLQIQAAGGIEFYKGQILYISRAGRNAYPLPLVDVVLTDMSTDEGLSNVNNRNVRNNFLTAGMLITKRGQGSSTVDGDKDGVSSDDGFTEEFEKLQGDTNSLKIMQVEIETDEDKPEFVPFKTNNYDKEFTATTKAVTDNIYAALNQETFGRLRSGSIGFTGDLANDVKREYCEQVAKQQRMLSRAYRAIFSHWKPSTIPYTGAGDAAIEPLVKSIANDATSN